jgi:hypothetical protein
LVLTDFSVRTICSQSLCHYRLESKAYCTQIIFVHLKSDLICVLPFLCDIDKSNFELNPEVPVVCFVLQIKNNSEREGQQGNVK